MTGTFLNKLVLASLLLPLAFLGSPHSYSPIIKRTYVYKTVGDLHIRADVYRKNDGTITPAILYIHSGALIMGNRSWLNRIQTEKYLDAGYSVISIDYRLAPETKLPQILEDVADAYRWIRLEGPQLFQIDSSRIAVVGHSAGGYLALMTGFRVDPPPSAIVSFYGYGDIAGEWYCKPDPFYNRQPLVSKEEAYQSVGTGVISEDEGGKRERFYLYTRQQGVWPIEVTGHDPDKEHRMFDKFCPVRNITEDYPPTLLLHGDRDTDVPFEQSVLVSKELERSGVKHTFLALKGKGHEFDRAMDDREVAKAFDSVLAFMKRQL